MSAYALDADSLRLLALDIQLEAETAVRELNDLADLLEVIEEQAQAARERAASRNQRSTLNQ